MKGYVIKSTQLNLSSSLEDYLEAIYNLADENKITRSKDIAEALNVAKPSVTGALKTLSEKGLVNYEPYGYITLTETGAKRASTIARKHDIIKSFFTDVLGVDKMTAQTAACKVEHSLGPAIISRLLSLIEFSKKKDEAGRNLAQRLQQYYDNQPDRDKK